MNSLLTHPASRYALWLLLSAPAAHLLYRYTNGDTFYGEVVHQTGFWAMLLLILALAVSPVRLLLPSGTASRWLLQSRRYFGVASFAYASLHTTVYLQKKGSLERVIQEGAEPGLLTGWLALAIFLPLAITSNDWFVRQLRKWWKHLHRSVYLATALVFAHWLMTAFDQTSSLNYLGLVLGLECLRLIVLVIKGRVK
ncbi:MAG: ferric reductase-like transmembrane domain-containing protein [Pseudomonadota bacterium]